MDTLEITTQEEYEANKDFGGLFIIKSGRIVLRDSASAVLWGNASAVLRGNASAVLWGNASAELWDNASAELRDNASAELWDSASAVLWGNASADAIDNAHILRRSERNIVRVAMNATVKDWQEPKYDATILDFLANKNGPDLVLYKCVNPENDSDFRTGTIKYEIGKEAVAPDWDADPSIQCGSGLHLCTSAMGTKRYANGKIFKCLVRPEDVAVYEGDISKVRCRAVRPIAVVNLHGDEIQEDTK